MCDFENDVCVVGVFRSQAASHLHSVGGGGHWLDGVLRHSAREPGNGEVNQDWNCADWASLCICVHLNGWKTLLTYGTELTHKCHSGN